MPVTVAVDTDGHNIHKVFDSILLQSPISQSLERIQALRFNSLILAYNFPLKLVG